MSDEIENPTKERSAIRKGVFFNHISIKNFKSFKSLNAGGFGQINLITGKNNAGKTSFLEALYLCLGPTNPTLWLNTFVRRGLDRVSPRESIVPYLFHQLDSYEPIIFDVTTASQLRFQLAIELLNEIPIEISPPKSEGNGKTLAQSISMDDLEPEIAIKLTYLPNDDQNARVTYATISNEGISFSGNRTNIFPDSIFLSNHLGPDVEKSNAERYSTLDKAGRTSEFEQHLQTIEPSLRRTSLAIENGRPLVHGDVGHGLVPLATLGSGMTKLTSILVSITQAQNTIVLVDEIENSFHHTILESVWTGIAEFALHTNCQIFATTHSDECVAAAYKMLKNHPKKNTFRLHRLVKKTAKTELFTFSEDEIEAALSGGWDLR